jgi:hypothetical protein
MQSTTVDPATDTEHILRTHRLPGLEETLPGEFVLPHYDGYSIANLPATIARLLGVELADAAPPLPGYLWVDMAADVRSVVTITLDAVGYLHLRRLMDAGDPALRSLSRVGQLVPLTSVFPSTTVAALTTLWTGRAPLAHGLIGTRLLLPEHGMLANMLQLGPAVHRQSGALLDWGWVPEEFVTVPGLGQQLASQGIETVAHTHLPFLGGGLARIFMRGMDEVRGHVDFSDMAINLRHALVQRSDRPLFASAYWGGLDDTAHVYGPDGERFRAALRHVLCSLEEDFLAHLPAAAREGTLLLIAADHGQISTPPEQVVQMSDHPALRRMLLLPPAGEPRASYLYVRPGQAEAVRAYVADHLPGRFIVLEVERALAAGLFGPEEPASEVRVRLGDLLLLATDDSRLLVKDEPVPFHGHHGGLTPEEMLVPLLMVRLDDL